MGDGVVGGVGVGVGGVVGVPDLEGWEEDTLFFFLDDDFTHSPPNNS